MGCDAHPRHPSTGPHAAERQSSIKHVPRESPSGISRRSQASVSPWETIRNRRPDGRCAWLPWFSVFGLSPVIQRISFLPPDPSLLQACLPTILKADPKRRRRISRRLLSIRASSSNRKRFRIRMLLSSRPWSIPVWPSTQSSRKARTRTGRLHATNRKTILHRVGDDPTAGDTAPRQTAGHHRMPSGTHLSFGAGGTLERAGDRGMRNGSEPPGPAVPDGSFRHHGGGGTGGAATDGASPRTQRRSQHVADDTLE